MYMGMLPPAVDVADIMACAPIITIIGDLVYEGEEELTLSSASDVNISSISSSTANFSIIDPEGISNH